MGLSFTLTSQHPKWQPCQTQPTIIHPSVLGTVRPLLPQPSVFLITSPPLYSQTHNTETPSRHTFFDRKKKLNPHHSTITTPIIIPANFSIATLFPCCAMRPSRLAEPFMEFVMEEKTSDCLLREREGVLARSWGT